MLKKTKQKFVSLILASCIIITAMPSMHATNFLDIFNIFKIKKTHKASSKASLIKKFAANNKLRLFGAFTVAAIIGIFGIYKWLNPKKTDQSGPKKPSPDPKPEQKPDKKIGEQNSNPDKKIDENKNLEPANNKSTAPEIPENIPAKLEQPIIQPIAPENNQAPQPQPAPEILPEQNQDNLLADPIIEKTENELSLLKNLSNIKVDGIDFLEHKYFATFKNNKAIHLNENRKKPILDLTQDTIMFFAFIDTEENTKQKSKKYVATAGIGTEYSTEYTFKNNFVLPLRQNIIDDYRNKTNKNLLDLSIDELKKLRTETTEESSGFYNIYININYEYLPSFIKDFLNFITKDEYGRFVDSLCFSKIDGNEGKARVGLDNIIEANLSFIPGTKKEKNKILNKIINAIKNRYKYLSEEITITSPKRTMRKINNFLFIAHQNDFIDTMSSKINTKKTYQKNICYGNLPINNILTDDYAFFKGYEYEPEEALFSGKIKLQDGTPLKDKALKKYKDCNIKFSS